MPPLTVDGVVHPDEYEVRVDTDEHPVQVHPAGAPRFCEIYYAFDGAALHFGVRRTQPVKLEGVALWIDPDRNGCEVGDLLVAVEPEHKLTAYGIFEGPGEANHMAGTPPDPAAAGVEARIFAEGDAEIRLLLAKQYANGFAPNPLPETISANVTVKARHEGKMIVNFLKDVPIQTFVIAFE